ncbi:hypothetical protein F5X97DRAFT_308231 [Nemania serpens]|nr:hypothetical protein F5X97DRAFT_308231 [Nemania serpens]
MATRTKRFPISAQEQQSLLNACSSGDTGALRRFFAEHGVQQGGNPLPVPVQDINTDSSAKPPNTSLSADTLLEQAVAARQLAVVELILQTHPKPSLAQSHGIVRAVLENPDPKILQVLCGHDRDFASFSVDYGMRTLLTDACALPPAQAVLVLHVLLDNDGDVNDGWGPGGGALYAAIIGRQPVEIVGRILYKTSAVSNRNAIAAIRRGDVDVVRALFSRESVRWKFGVDECVEEAKKTGEEEIVAVVETWAREKAENEARGRDGRPGGKRRNIWNFWH